MLAYLEALRDALVAREVEAIRRLLAHPLAGALTDAVRAEAQRVMQGLMPPIAAPIATLQLYHQTAHCLGVAREGRSHGRLAEAPAPRALRPAAQIELPLQVA